MQKTKNLQHFPRIKHFFQPMLLKNSQGVLVTVKFSSPFLLNFKDNNQGNYSQPMILEPILISSWFMLNNYQLLTLQM
jgi:hypothetical protein